MEDVPDRLASFTTPPRLKSFFIYLEHVTGNDSRQARSPLRDQLAERLESAVAPSTRAAYRRGWGQWSAWASAHGFAVRPATPESVGAYADQLARSGRKPSSIRFALAAIAAGHRAADLESPITEGVRRTVQAIERNHRDDGGTVKQSAGITADVLARIEATAHRPRKRGRGIESDASAAARARLDVAIVRVMRDTLARVSEAASMTWGQIERQPDGVGTIAFRRPKTDSDTTAYLSPSTIAVLDAIRPADAGQDTTLFGLKPAMLKRRIKAACKAAGGRLRFPGPWHTRTPRNASCCRFPSQRPQVSPPVGKPEWSARRCPGCFPEVRDQRQAVTIASLCHNGAL